LKKLDIEFKVISMKHYRISQSPGFGWPPELAWVNPSPNMPRLSTVRAYAGTVLIEGTNLSEGRGTTLPLELIGAPDIDAEKIVNEMKRIEPKWIKGCALRPLYFEPTFQKHCHQLCSGIQIHIDHTFYNHYSFKPFRLVALFLKSLRNIYPDYELWRSPPYEYEKTKLPIDILAGSDFLRKWVDDSNSSTEDLDQALNHDEAHWIEESRSFHLYE
ncbi:MAG: DUF1343 domain-containing protein, partial [Bdellovibrionales bacterium]|nr:DUF1343 domain-containing protein [Bdellovibrionales bacterium]